MTPDIAVTFLPWSQTDLEGEIARALDEDDVSRAAYSKYPELGEVIKSYILDNKIPYKVVVRVHRRPEDVRRVFNYQEVCIGILYTC